MKMKALNNPTKSAGNHKHPNDIALSRARNPGKLKTWGRPFSILFLIIGIYSLYGFAMDPLPPKFGIYVNAKGIVRTRPAVGYCPVCIRVANIFYKTPGCYITCHTTNPDKAVYAVSPNIYVTGMIRVEGNYEGKICKPRDYEKAVLRNEPIFQELCSKTFSCIGNSCWAEGDTGGLFGLKP